MGRPTRERNIQHVLLNIPVLSPDDFTAIRSPVAILSLCVVSEKVPVVLAFVENLLVAERW
jgi:hypothetical protein